MNTFKKGNLSLIVYDIYIYVHTTMTRVDRYFINIQPALWTSNYVQLTIFTWYKNVYRLVALKHEIIFPK